MTTWARSEVYGSSVLLGPTQAAVYRFVMGVTEHGRRPSYTLDRISRAVGKPVSSVHSALGRLRALGLIGMSARMGRTGGHRLWRVGTGRARHPLDLTRRKRAIARIIRRWYVALSEGKAGASSPPTLPLFPDSSEGGGVDDAPRPSPSGPSFRERIGLHHRLPWETDGGLAHGNAQHGTYPLPRGGPGR